LGAERITTTVIRGGRLGAGHGRPARMSESHAGTSRKTFFGLHLPQPSTFSYKRSMALLQAIDKKKEAHKDLLSIIVKKQQYRRRTAKVPAAAG